MKNGSFCNKISDCIIVFITQHAAGEGGALFDYLMYSWVA